MVIHKLCNTCNCEKLLQDFGKDSSTKDGLRRICRSCRKIESKKYRDKNIEKVKLTNKRSHRKMRDKGHYSPSSRLYFLKRRAKLRKNSFNITLEQFKLLLSKPCYWCEDIDSNTNRLGLDRLDNKLGYEINNVVTCCEECNDIRSDNVSISEFPIIINALKLYRKEGIKPELNQFNLYMPNSNSRNRRNSGYTKLVLQAKNRNKQLLITKDQYFTFIKDKSCYYCGSVLPISGHGLDRIDSKLPYIISNVLPSCPVCNEIKRDNLTVEETEVVVWTLCKIRNEKI